MMPKRNRERVVAEISLSHLVRLASEHGCCVSQDQAAAFFNQEGHAYEMWKQMMQAGEEFIASKLTSTMNYPSGREGMTDQERSL